MPGPYFKFNWDIINGGVAPHYPSYDSVNFMRSFANSIIVVAVVVAGTLFFCSLAGFAFAKLRFKGRDPLFYFVVLTLTIPAQLGIVGAYQIMAEDRLDRHAIRGHDPGASLGVWRVLYAPIHRGRDSRRDHRVRARRWCLHLPRLHGHRPPDPAPRTWRAGSADRGGCVERVHMGARGRWWLVVADHRPRACTTCVRAPRPRPPSC